MPTYILKSPKGNIFETDNLTQFCKENDLCRRTITRVITKERVHYKGWKASKKQATTKVFEESYFIDHFKIKDTYWYNAEDVLKVLGYKFKGGKCISLVTKNPQSFIQNLTPRRHDNGNLWWDDVALAKLKFYHKDRPSKTLKWVELERGIGTSKIKNISENIKNDSTKFSQETSKVVEVKEDVNYPAEVFSKSYSITMEIINKTKCLGLFNKNVVCSFELEGVKEEDLATTFCDIISKGYKIVGFQEQKVNGEG